MSKRAGTRRARRRGARHGSARETYAGRDVDVREDAPSCRPRLPSCGARAGLPIESRTAESEKAKQHERRARTRDFFERAPARAVPRAACDTKDVLVGT